ncbi:hypothetical protein SAMN05216311_112156 [Chitinophaga sp. CF418]|nr:hypothetical protein SAMN05216311_112156 [Chitinophaga sp. CF418]
MTPLLTFAGCSKEGAPVTGAPLYHLATADLRCRLALIYAITNIPALKII